MMIKRWCCDLQYITMLMLFADVILTSIHAQHIHRILMMMQRMNKFFGRDEKRNYRKQKKCNKFLKSMLPG